MRWAIVAAAMAMAVPAFGQIVLDHHEELSVEQARQLVEKNERALHLWVTTLPLDVATVFSTYEGDLSLDFLTTISATATSGPSARKSSARRTSIASPPRA